MMDALTKYYQAKEREESAVLYINNSFLETMSSLEKLEAEYEHMRLKDMSIIGGLEEENAKLRRLLHLIFNEDYNDEFVELMCDLRIEETTND